MRQFVETNDHQAFEILLARHGPMVLGTARRLVNNAADADDVFQAAFLSLVQLAKSIREGQNLANWLYTTTCRIAARARRRRTTALENAPEPSAVSAVDTDLVWCEVRTVLDEELQRLPERLRSPLLLCYLSGLTREEAAKQLGWSLGTLKRRLQEGRAALRKRLERRGISAAGLALAVLSPMALDATVRPALARACLDAAFGKEAAAGVTALLLTTTTTLKGIAMKAIIVALALIGLSVGIYSSFGRANPAKTVEEANSEEPKAAAKRVDSLGDPLPAGAIMRLGTRRFRERAWPWEPRPVYWQSRADGVSYLVRHGNVHSSEIRRIDSKTGGVVESWPIPKVLGALAWASQDHRMVGFSPDGRYVLWTNDYIHHGVVDSAQEWHLTLYDLTERKQVWSLVKNLEPQDWPHVGMCVFSANNKWLVTGRPYGNEVRLWDARIGKQLWEHRNKGQSPSPICFVDNDETVVLRGDEDGYVHLLDRARGTEKKSFSTVKPQCWGQVLLSPEGKHLIVCTSQPPSVWDLEGKQVAVLEGHKTWANAAGFSPDGKKLYTGSYDSFVIEREWPSGKPIRKIELGRDRLQRLAVTPDGKRLQVVFEGEQALVFYDLRTRKRLPEPIASHRAAVFGVECAPDGSLVSFGCDRSVQTWDLKQGKSVSQFAVELDLNGRGFALSPDGTRVAVANYDAKSIGIYERLTGKRIRNIPSELCSRPLGFSPDSRLLAALNGMGSRSAQVWDADTGVQLLKVQSNGHGDTVTGHFGPDGRTFAFKDGRRVRMLDTATWKDGIGIQTPPLGWEPLGLEYSPDGRMIATASQDGVRLYEVATRSERAHVQAPGSATGILRFSHNGRLLAWVNDNSKILVLDVRTGVMTGPFTGHDDEITGLAFTIDDKALASSSGDCTILIWGVSAKTVAKTATNGNLDQDWQLLRGEDAQKAFTAMRALAAHPETALKMASEHLGPAEPIDPQWLASRLRDLDHQEFSERERATRELEEFGDRVASGLEKILATKPSLEASKRTEKILEKIRGRVAEGQAAQSLRALEVLEWIGTAKARELVEKLAKGAEGVSFTVDAKRSLKRWKSYAE